MLLLLLYTPTESLERVDESGRDAGRGDKKP